MNTEETDDFKYGLTAVDTFNVIHYKLLSTGEGFKRLYSLALRDNCNLKFEGKFGSKLLMNFLK